MKQFFVKISLAFLRALIVFKRRMARFLQGIKKPLSTVGLFLVRFFGVPIYRAIFLLKRFFGRLARPTKHKVLSLITNRYAMHGVMVCLITLVIVANVNARDVRAESFGQESMLYALVVVDDARTVEVVEATDRVAVLGRSSSYLSDTFIDARAHIDVSDFDDPYATPLTGDQLETEDRVVPERDAVEIYIVQEGDSLGKIAERYGLNLSTVLWSNNLTLRSTIRPGDEITIMPVDGVTYTVRSGDTLSRIARNHNVETGDILAANDLRSADTLSIGQDLLIPGGEPPSVSQVARRSASVGSLFSAPSSSSRVGGWIWPTDWHVITQYYGWRHTGLDVDGDYSTYSYASRDGVVIFSGWRYGYGLTVELDHGDGYVTRYAHHSKNFVNVGTFVSAGEAIARTGTTGRSTGTHLHFEIIKNGRFQNPLDYLR